MFSPVNKHKRSYQFKAITRLRLFDIKAQKKTIPYKKFCSIPLTYEQTLKENFDSLKNTAFPFPVTGTNGERHPRQSILKRLAKPKRIASSGKEKENKIDRIMGSCKTLMRRGNRFRERIVRFEKHSERCLSQIEKRVNFIINEGSNHDSYN